EYVFFFFQAEDGIRDKLVTGVQTCALPISDGRRPAGTRAGSACRSLLHRPRALRRYAARCRSPPPAARASPGCRWKESHAASARSEERRVGKEWRVGWGRGEATKKVQKDCV